jgi:uncharacterized membrane-anchored protein
MNAISRRRLCVASVWVGLQLLFFVGWARHEEGKLADGVGRSILVRTVPVDPRDLLRGQYVSFAYEWSRGGVPGLGESPVQGTEVWVVLGPDGEFHVPLRVEDQRPVPSSAEEVAIRGRIGAAQRLEFGIEKYFVPEGTETPAAQEITVRLRVGTDGVPRIEQVYKQGSPWP